MEGSLLNKPRNVRAANRNRNRPDNRTNNLGFRLAQSTRNRVPCLMRYEPGAAGFKDSAGVTGGYP